MKKKEKYLEHDDSTVALTTHAELAEYLQYRKEHDVWIEPFINEMAVVGIPYEPLFIPGYCREPKIKVNGYSIDVDPIDFNSTEVMECVEGTGVFLVFPENGRYKAYPIRDIAYDSICKRAGDDCATMARFDSKPNKKVLPVVEKAERLTRDFGLYSDVCRILYRDKKISMVLSKEYCILDDSELVAVLEGQLAIDHPDFSFSSAEVSHAYLNVTYMLNDPETEETFRLKLNEHGEKIEELKAGIEFCTSDIGLSRVRANVFYDIDGVRMYSEHGIGIRHDNGARGEDFSEACRNLGDILKESEEQIEILGNTDIRDVAEVLKRILKKYPYFPKEMAVDMVDRMKAEYPNGGTAIDVYLAVCELYRDYCAGNSVSLNKRITLSESVARMMKLPFDKIDAEAMNEAW